MRVRFSPAAQKKKSADSCGGLWKLFLEGLIERDITLCSIKRDLKKEQKVGGTIDMLGIDAFLDVLGLLAERLDAIYFLSGKSHPLELHFFLLFFFGCQGDPARIYGVGHIWSLWLALFAKDVHC